jgi:diadenosine tetraphosphate (Ap4A) HIT family hydrolase
VTASSRASGRSAGTACPLCEAERLLRAGGHAWAVADLSETFAVLGENQGCPGWCVLILKGHVEHLAELTRERQLRVFDDVSRVAAAVRAVFPSSGAGGGPPRINYECLGNLVAHVHWHVIPRHADDPEPTRPVWGRTPDRLRGTLSERERVELARRLREACAKEMV